MQRNSTSAARLEPKIYAWCPERLNVVCCSAHTGTGTARLACIFFARVVGSIAVLNDFLPCTPSKLTMFHKFLRLPVQYCSVSLQSDAPRGLPRSASSCAFK